MRVPVRPLFLVAAVIGVLPPPVVAQQAALPVPQVPAAPMVVSKAQQALADALLDAGLADRGAFRMLEDLVTAAPKRLSGSPGYARAVEWGERALLDAGLQNVRRMPVMVPRWERGTPERAFATLDDGSRLELAVCALGGSVATPAAGLTAPVVELAGMDALRAAGESVRGKIVFLSEPMAPTRRATFEAYGGAVGQRSRGAIEAARLGAVGVVIRSMSTAQDDAPHTGAMRYEDGVERIPAGALGVTSALRLARALRRGEVRSLTLAMHCRTLPEVEQWTVVGELPGTDLADQVVVVGGHLDAWDKGVGAHDDGSGCAQSIEAARLLKKVGHRPRRTLRVVLFANEENGLRGGRAYAEETRDEPHYLAMESDSGGFSPRGIALALPEASLARLRPLGAPLAVVGAERVLPGGEGADIGPLAARGALLASLRPDDARYFDVHHSDNDVLAAVNPRELELGAVVMAYWLAVLDGIEDLP